MALRNKITDTNESNDRKRRLQRERQNTPEKGAACIL